MPHATWEAKSRDSSARSRGDRTPNRRGVLGASLATLATLLPGALLAADEAEPLAPSPAAVVSEDVRRLVEEQAGRGVIVNLWATWCLPCREEMPALLETFRAHEEAGLSLILVSGDFPEDIDEVRRFLGGLGVDFPSYIKDEKDGPFIDGVHADWSGALPATLVYDRDGRLIQFHEGEADREQFEDWARRALAGDPARGLPEPGREP